MEQFNGLRGNNGTVKVDSASYGEIKEWFLATFTEFGEYAKKRDDIIRSIKEQKEVA